MKNKFEIKALPLLMVLLFILLPVLAYFQYSWIGELSEREKEHLRGTIELSTIQYSRNIIQTLLPFQRSLNIRDTVLPNDVFYNLILKNLKSLGTSNENDMMHKVLIFDKDTPKQYIIVDEKKDIPIINRNLNELSQNEKVLFDFFQTYSWDNHESLLNNFDLIIIPVMNYGHTSKLLVVELDPKLFKKNLILKNFNTIFPQNTGLNIVLCIKNYQDSILFTSDEKYLRENKYQETFQSYFGLLPPFGAPPNKMFKEHNEPRSMDRFFNDMLRRNNNRKDFDFLPPILKPMKISVGLKSGSLDDEIAKSRMRNLLISYSILSLLGFIVLLITYLSSKAKNLANQQMLFVAGVSHDLRTPLTVIRTASENISDGIIDSTKIQLYGKLIRQETDRLWQLIETTLSFAGIQSNKRIYNFKEVSINDVIGNAIDFCNNINAGKNIEIINKIANELPKINGDENALNTVFQNLLVNAIKFSYDDVEIFISSEIELKKKTLAIKIKDNGIGISSKDLNHIFEPFYRSNEAIELSIHGNGVGLTLVKKIIEAHHGEISVNSKPKFGSTFSIKFPI